MSVVLAVLVTVVVVLAVALAVALAALRRRQQRIDALSVEAERRSKVAVKSSRSTILGQITEQLVPILPGFPYHPKDARWLGGAVDFVVWNGLEAGGDVEVVFLEVKTGKSALRSEQRRIRDAVNEGRVRFRVHKLDGTEAPATDPLAFTEEELTAEFLSDEEAAALDAKFAAGDSVTRAD